jgi:nucleoside-diphosphate-sugar epimerase
LAWEGLPKRNEDLSLLNLEKSKYFVGELARIYPLARFYILGSCLEYGDLIGPVSDITIPEGDSFFARAKIQLHEFVDKLNINYIWYRPFFVYGKGQNINSLIPYLINSCENKTKIELNDFTNSHDFISVTDLTSAILTSSNSNYKGNINLGTGNLTSVMEIVKMITERYDIKFESQETPRSGMYSKSDLLLNEFSWKPRYLGIDGILEYYFGEKEHL